MKQTFLAMIRNSFGSQHAAADASAWPQQLPGSGAVRLIDRAELCHVAGGGVETVQSPYRGWSTTQTEAVQSPYRGW